jgi:hypothetical protein
MMLWRPAIFALRRAGLSRLAGHMATKADIAELRLEIHTFRAESEVSFRSLRTELAEINKRLDMVEQKYGNFEGRHQGDR